MLKPIVLASAMILGFGTELRPSQPKSGDSLITSPNGARFVREGGVLRLVERPAPAAPAGPRTTAGKGKRNETVPDAIIVKFKGTATATQEIETRGVAALRGLSSGLDEVNRRFPPRKVEPVFPGAKAAVERAQRLKSAAPGGLGADEDRIRRRLLRAPPGVEVPALENIFRIDFQKAPGFNLDEVIEAYRRDANVEYVQRIEKFVHYLAPNDPDYPRQWSLNNVGQDYPTPNGGSARGTADADIDAPEAWSQGTGSQDVVVGVIDGGVDYTHPDLAANMWKNLAELNGRPGVDDDGNGLVDDIYGYDFSDMDPDPMDESGHGTHVSGTIAARGNNGSQVVGVCWQARIMAVKVFDNSTSDVLARGIRYAVDMGADVLNDSWGPSTRNDSDRVVEDAVAYAVAQGCIPIFAAGNSSDDASFYSPQNSPYTISVGATDANDEAASFSNYGPEVDLAAPGVDILSTWLGGGTEIISGTSMACPHVVGAVALMLSHNPSLTYDQVRGLLRGSGDAAPEGLTVSGKRLNLSHVVAAVVSGNLAPAVEAGGPYSVKYPQTSVTLAGKATDDGKPTGSPFTHRWSLLSGPGPVAIANPNALSTTVTFSAAGHYVFRLAASDGQLDAFGIAVVDVSLTRQVGQVSVDARDLEVGGGFAYAAGGEFIRKINVSNPAAPSVVATYRSAGANFVHLSLLGTTLFAADSAKRLVSVNASTMAQSGAVNVTGIRDVHAFDGFAYLAAGKEGLKVYNVANPAAMTASGSYDGFDTAQSFDMVRSNGHWACLGGSQAMVIVPVDNKSRINVHYPLYPSEGDSIVGRDARFNGADLYVSGDNGVYFFRLEEELVIGTSVLESGSSVQNLALAADNVLYLGIGNQALTMYDVHDRDHVERLERHPFAFRLRDFQVASRFIYALTEGNLRILETDLPNTAPSVNLPVLANGSLARGAQLAGDVQDDGTPPGGSLTFAWTQVSGPGTATFHPSSAAATTATFSVDGEYVLRLTASDGDRSSSAEVRVYVSKYLEKVASLPDPANRSANVTDKVKVQDGFLWQLESGFIGVYDISNPRNPILIGGHTDLAEDFKDFKVQGNYVYAAGLRGLTILDFTNKAAPKVVSRLDNVNGNTEANSVALAGNFAYVSYLDQEDLPGHTNGFYPVNIANKAAPVASMAYIRADAPGAVEADGSTLYFISNFGLQIADLANPAAPLLLSSLDIGWNYSITVQGGYLYAGNGDQIYIADISNRYAPRLAGGIIIPDVDVTGFQFFGNPSGNYLFATEAVHRSGFAVWDITDKSNPVLRDQYAMHGFGYAVHDKGTVYVEREIGMDVVAATLPNTRPDVFAGQDTEGSGDIQLSGSAADDGGGPLTFAWSKVSGPGTATFRNAAQARTTVSFGAPGTYVLRLTASDGSLSASDEVTVRSSGDTFLQDVGSGLVVFEAENFHSKAAQGGHDWTRTATAGSSGGAAMQTTPNNGANVNTGYVTGSPRLDFKVSFVKAGTHYIWARGIGPTPSDDSYHAGLDNIATPTSDRIDNFTTTYSWRKLDMDGGQANFNVPSASVHTVNAWMREDGFIVDKLLVTPSATYVPTGTGPAESPRGQLHFIRATAGPGGKISSLGVTQLQHGASKTYTLTPDPDFSVYKLVVDGVSQGPLTSYTFTAVAGDHLIQAFFRQTPLHFPIAAVTATADDGNGPENAIDGNLNTRWSAFGDPQSITFDLGEFHQLQTVKIAFYKGNERRYTFDVEISDDGETWNPLRTSIVSSGTTAGLEEFEVPQAFEAFVRIVGHGSNVSLWNSYSEIELWGL